MKNNRSFACPGAVALSLIGPLAGCIFILICQLSFLHLNIKVFIPIEILLYIMQWLFYFILYKNAYIKTTINETGIHNKYLSINWNDIKSYKSLNIELQKYSLFKTIVLQSVIVFGNYNNGSFAAQNPRECIIVAMTKRNVSLIIGYGRESASDAIKDIINYYNSK